MKDIGVISCCAMLILASCAHTSFAPRSAEALAHLQSLMDVGKFQEAADFFETHDPRGGYDDTQYVAEFCLLGSEAYMKLADLEMEKENPSKERVDFLLKKAVWPLKRP